MTYDTLNSEIRDAISETDALLERFGCRRLTGAELEQVAAQCTDIKLIKNPFPPAVPQPHGPMQVGCCSRRNEDRDAMRGGK